MSYSRRYSKQQQQGSALIVAIFVIVVMAAMAAAMLRVAGSAQDITTREVLSTRAWFTAHSANEDMMRQLFPLAGTASDPAVDICQRHHPDTGTAYTFAPAGINGCRAATTCQSTSTGSVNTYLLVSSASCGSAPHTVSRIQELWAKDLDNE
ncbi:MSHA biogenesis protein MshP [Photobacterium halotolerans]|uniref:MSHA biogenesis protein MshP n=1 Tax=Photobacterium halotolerans TaxID=265726 RepID=UPI0013734A34|nr:MSHA biogenesis protein MshP [Photobacterium halotolerans]NAX49369.1 MSHA biogenesis protein MshP [Photobacterium halotolerans]